MFKITALETLTAFSSGNRLAGRVGPGRIDLGSALSSSWVSSWNFLRYHVFDMKQVNLLKILSKPGQQTSHSLKRVKHLDEWPVLQGAALPGEPEPTAPQSSGFWCTREEREIAPWQEGLLTKGTACDWFAIISPSCRALLTVAVGLATERKTSYKLSECLNGHSLTESTASCGSCGR